jgi:hypothetical protein
LASRFSSSELPRRQLGAWLLVPKAPGRGPALVGICPTPFPQCGVICSGGRRLRVLRDAMPLASPLVKLTSSRTRLRTLPLHCTSEGQRVTLRVASDLFQRLLACRTSAPRCCVVRSSACRRQRVSVMVCPCDVVERRQSLLRILSARSGERGRLSLFILCCARARACVRACVRVRACACACAACVIACAPIM